jgi:TRAP-type C4-dicarboxylate transport system permease small subunit
MRKTIGLLDAALRLLCSAAAWLALPVVAALFLQWPLRDALRCCSREANDLGQWLFALYIAVAVTAATRAGTHLAADTWSKLYPAIRRRRLAAAGEQENERSREGVRKVRNYRPTIDPVRFGQRP